MMEGANLIKIHCKLICKYHNEIPCTTKKGKRHIKKLGAMGLFVTL
jgi:hypothetical protein